MLLKGVFVYNKDENAHRYAVRGNKVEKEMKRERERERETPWETRKGEHKIITRKVDKKRLPSILLHKSEQLIEILRI